MASEFTFSPPRNGWISVSGPGLDEPTRVRVGVVGARLRIIGLAVDGHSPITSATLKRIALGQITTELVNFIFSTLNELHDQKLELKRTLGEMGFDPDAIDPHFREAYYAGVAPANPEQEAALYFHEIGAMQFELVELVTPLPADDPDRPLPRGRKAPTDDMYREFARVYANELRGGRGAVRRTSEKLNIHRSTANRYLRVCQQRGWLPREVES